MAVTFGKPAEAVMPPVMPPLQEKEVAFILDKSGSMMSQRELVISGYNEFIGDLKREKELLIRFSLTLFDTQVGLAVEGKPMNDVPELKIPTYVPGGNTALYDALGQTLNALERRLRGNTTTAITVVIMTDGQENSSREFDEKMIREKIAALDKLPNWTFAFMGADQDAWVAAGRIGIPQGNTMSYPSSSTGEAMSSNNVNVTSHIRSGNLKTKRLYHDEPEKK